MALAALRSRLARGRERYRDRMIALGPGRLRIVEAPGLCPICGGAMCVQKTVRKQGRTLAHGSFDASETIHACVSGCRWPSGARVVRRAVSLGDALLPGSLVGYDVMVLVGLKRFLHHRQREEIQAELLDQYGVSISTGHISNLTRRFVHYLARLHQAKASDMRSELDRDGGWPLHADATGEAGRGTLLIAIAGWRKWVVGAWKISTERADLILACLQQVVKRSARPARLCATWARP